MAGMEPQLFMVGVSHHTAPLALRERMAIPLRQLPGALASVRACAGVQEAVILSTCNRVELYVLSGNPPESEHGLIDFFSHYSRLPVSQFHASLYCKAGADAATHLFRVTAGLESMMLGESEVTAQVKQAYEVARAAGTTGSGLNPLFQKALHSTKVVRSRTRIADGQASIGSVVTTLARRLFPERFPHCSVLLWGAGKAAEATARYLIKAGVRRLWVVSRTPTNAQALAGLCQAGWLSWEEALHHLPDVDLAIICTQAPHYVIDQADVAAVLPQREGRVLGLIDLAVPRNVDPALKGHPGIRLYDMDDLQAMAQHTLALRQQERVRCEMLINEQVRYLVHRRQSRPQEESACRSIAALASG